MNYFLKVKILKIILQTLLLGNFIQGSFQKKFTSEGHLAYKVQEKFFIRPDSQALTVSTNSMVSMLTL